jgi:hypothetical protein
LRGSARKACLDGGFPVVLVCLICGLRRCRGTGGGLGALFGKVEAFGVDEYALVR